MNGEKYKNLNISHNAIFDSNSENEENTIRQWLGFADEESFTYSPDYFNEGCGIEEKQITTNGAIRSSKDSGSENKHDGKNYNPNLTSNVSLKRSGSVDLAYPHKYDIKTTHKKGIQNQNEHVSEFGNDLFGPCAENYGINDVTDEFDYTEIEREFLSQCISDETIDNNIATEEIDSIEIEKDILSHCVATNDSAKDNHEIDIENKLDKIENETSSKKVIVKCVEGGIENSITLYFEKDDEDGKIVSETSQNIKATDNDGKCDDEENWLDSRDVEDPDDSSKRFGCIKCEYKTKKMGNLREHMKNIHNKKTAETFQCPECDFKTVYRRNLTFHSRVHNRLQKYHCDVCDKDFNRKNNLDSHVLKHHPDDVHLVTSKFYTCKYCDFKTLRKNELALHMFTHSKQVAELFTCGQCSYTSYYKSAMTRHMAIHSLKKPHICKGCGKDFAQKLHLYAHILNHHTDDKELSASISCKIHCCDYCEYRCVFAHTYKLHLKSHNL